MNFFLCDDDASIQAVYTNEIHKLCKKHNLLPEIHCFSNGQQLLFAFDESVFPIDVIFLDINMPGIDGIAVAEKLREHGCKSEIVFLTVSEKHFLSAFDVGASNYLVKNDTTDPRFERVFLKVINAAREKEKEYALFTCGGEHRSIAIQDIKYFEVLHRIVTIHYGDNESFEIFATLGKLENELCARGFVRSYRSYLVSVAHIEKLEHKELQIRNGPKIPVSRAFYSNVKTAMDQYHRVTSYG